jgi:cytochrome c2
MKSILFVSLLILLMPSAHAASPPGDSAAGKRLLEANCMECHQTDIYTREDRRIKSLDALKAQLVSCTHMAEKDFSASEMQDLIKYLNDQFYHFQ